MTEELALFLFTLVLFTALPLGWAVLLLKREHKRALSLYLQGATLILFSLYAFFKGQYYYLGSYYIRYLVLIVPSALVAITIWRWRQLPIPQGWNWRAVAALGIWIPASIGLLYVDSDILRGQFPEREPIEFQFPFKTSGTYLIQEGTSSRFTNRHYDTPVYEQRYAVDIGKLESGMLHNNLFGNQLADFHIFGQQISSPCAGEVVSLRNSTADSAPGDYESARNSGNYVAIQCGPVKAHMGHMKQNSLMVNLGDHVEAGQAIGLAGNSGFSTEPHLHIQATRLEGGVETPAPITFNGLYLTNHDLVKQ